MSTIKKEISSLFDAGWKKRVKAGASAFGIALDPGQLEMMACHADELCLWNKRFNITAITDPDEVAVKHFTDSLALVPFVPDHARVLDIGSGGGFPGFVLKITKPGTRVTLLEAARKKTNFLHHIIRKTGLNGITAFHSRAEDLCRDPAYGSGFDVVVSRALTSLERFYKLALPYLTENGCVLAMKGNLQLKEIQSLCLDNASIKIHRYHLPFEDHERSIVALKPKPR